MENKINITVSIAERPYNLAVLRRQESSVRKAANLVNNTIKSYSKTFNYKDHQDLFAMVALQTATKAITLEEEKTYREKEMGNKLKEMDNILTEHLEEINEFIDIKA
jgi:cell division protein ZapA